MIGKKINQLATELAPVSTDLTIIGDPTTGVSKKITLAQLGAIFSGAVSFYTNLAGFPATGDINVIYCAKDTQKLYLWSGSAYVEIFPSQALLDTYQLRSEKGNANGYASLDSQGKVPISQLPSSIMEYKGTWNASTNTPTLANGTGDTGDVYICNVAGTVNFGAGPITFAVGDYVIYSGTIWQRSSGAVGTVTSVAASITGNSVTISGSPVTTSGTLAFAFAGTGAQYIKGDGTLATFPNTIDQAKNLITEVYNSTGATLTKGTVVYINGGQGNLPTVTKALATGDSTSAQTYGIVQADITNNNNGFVVVAGRLADIDTSAFSVGTQLYLSSTTAGAYTSTKQYAPAHLVYVGIIVRSHPTQGIIEVKIQNGYELDELHNVAAQTPTNNDGLFWEASTSLWKNKSIATILGYTPQAQLNGTGFVKASGTTITYDNSTYLTTSAAATTYLPLVLSSTTNVVDINGQQFNIYGSGSGFTSGRIIIDPVFSAIGYQNAGVFDGLKILTNGNAEFSNSGVTRFFNQVRFDSTLTNGTYTYTLPGATGTIALTTDIPSLTGYVPYTGATTNLNLGSNNLTAAAITGTSARITTLAGSVYADVNGNLGTTSGTQDTLTYWASQYSIASLSTSTYPSLTELSYVKGVTSSIQTQLNAKQNTLTNPVTGTGTTNYLPKFTGTSTIGNSVIQEASSNIGIGGSPSGTYGKLSVFGGLSIKDDNNAKLEIGRYSSGASNSYIKLGANSNSLRFTNAGDLADIMELTNSGNLGLGVTPSAWSLGTALEIANGAAILGFSNETFIANNAYFNGGWKYRANATAQAYFMNGGEHKWQIAPSGTAGNAISFTQAMTLDASGRLGIGTTSPAERLHVVGKVRFFDAGYPYIDLGVSTSNYWRIINDNPNDTFVIGKNGASNFVLNSSGAATFSSSVTASGYSYFDGLRLKGTDNSATIWKDTGDMSIYPQNGKLYLGGQGTGNILTVTSSSVGIGTTSPSVALQVDASGGGIIRATRLGAGSAYIQLEADGTNGTLTSSAALIMNAGGSERMRITSGGSVCIGVTSPTNSQGLFVYRSNFAAAFQTDAGTGQEAIRFFNGSTAVGTIATTSSSTAYNTSSDYRLKQDLKDFNGLDLLTKIKTYDYEWKSDKTRSYGVIAHELQSVINYAVTGVKDGKEMQGVDYSKIVPVLIKAIQELNDKIK